MDRIAIDLGGHTLLGARINFSADPPVIVEKDEEKTPAGREMEDLLEAVCSLVMRLAAAHDVEAVGISSPGFVDKDGRIRHMHNFSGCEGRKLPMLFRERLSNSGMHVPVEIENDANCYALGERLCGIARGASDFVLMTLGTGIGFGIVANGGLVRGAHRKGSEGGHVVVADMSPCPCGGLGHLEAVAAADAVELRARGAGLPEDFEILWARRAEPTVWRVIEPGITALGQAAASLAHLLDPEMIILGGGMSRADGIAEEVRKAAQPYLSPSFAEDFRIEISKCGNDSALYGAASLWR